MKKDIRKFIKEKEPTKPFQADVRESLLDAVKKKAKENGHSLVQIAEAGLEFYLDSYK